MPDTDTQAPVSRQRRPRPRTVAIGALALLLAAAPFVPRGGDRDAITPSATPATSTTAGLGRLTDEMRAEIDAVVAEGRALGRVTGKSMPGELARSVVRCAVFEGQRYCLGSGWTSASESEVQARMAGAARVAARTTSRGSAERTGDVDAAELLQRRAAMAPARRARLERRELVDAARSVAKVWLLRHEIQGVPLPDGFLDRHPEARATTDTNTDANTSATSSKAAPATRAAAYPASAAILDPRHVAAQNRTYWCGPAALQMIQWGFWKKFVRQRKMARLLGTTTAGTAITDMVRVINRRSGWDNPEYAGRYITLDIKGWTFGQWWQLIERHIADYQAPVVLHPHLLKRFYPYLDDDASGHFQVGRGYKRQPNGLKLIGYFEPWNQQRFDRSEPFIGRVQWRRAYKSYRANQVHFQHNIGV